MSAYFAIFKMRLLTLLQYRSAALAGLATQVFFGVVKIMILTAFFESASQKQPLTLQQAVTFIWLGQAIFQMLPWILDKDIEAEIRSGNVAYQLVRPLDLYKLWFSRILAMKIALTALRAPLMLLLASLFFGLSAPISFGAGFIFSFSVCLSALLSSAITTLVLITLFWTFSGEGILRLLPHTSVLLSGLVVPLPFFPDWMQPFLSLQPFRGIIDIPCRIYTGVIPLEESFYYLGFQGCWILALILFGKWLLQKALRQIVIQGG